MKYRKKPVLIEAKKWNGNNIYEIVSFIENGIELKSKVDREKFMDYESIVKKEGLTIRTLEGLMKAEVGDYIIKGIKGEFYPCKPDIFEITYEKAE